MQSKKKYEIYTLSDPRTGEVRYVGLSQNALHRFEEHIKDALPNLKREWIAGLLEDELVPVLDVVDVVEGKKAALAAETEHIRGHVGESPILNKNGHSQLHKRRKKRNPAIRPRKKHAPFTEEHKRKLLLARERKAEGQVQKILEMVLDGRKMSRLDIREEFGIAHQTARKRFMAAAQDDRITTHTGRRGQTGKPPELLCRK